MIVLAGLPPTILVLIFRPGVHLPQLMGWKTSQDIVPHFMFERVRTQDKMPAGTDPDKSRNRNAVYTFGVAYLPIPEVALKDGPYAHRFAKQYID